MSIDQLGKAINAAERARKRARLAKPAKRAKAPARDGVMVAGEMHAQPDIANYPPLQEWLQRVGARCLRQTPVCEPGKRPPAMLEHWAVGGATFVIELRADKRGWDIFTSSPSTLIDATLEDAERRLGAPPAATPQRFFELVTEAKAMLGLLEPELSKLLPEGNPRREPPAVLMRCALAEVLWYAEVARDAKERT